MTRSVGIALLVGCLLPGCGGSQSNSTANLGGADPDAGAPDPSACDPSADYLKCDGKNVLMCTCTSQGAQLGTDLTGRPIYACNTFSWVQSSVCAVACDTTVSPTTACIASTTPVPECAQDGITCWNGNLTFCQNGYPLPTTPCAAGTACTLVPGCQALCLGAQQTTDPRCPALPGLSNDFCADNTAYHCACGYLLGTEVCGAAPNGCVTVSSYDSYDKVDGLAAECGLPP
jgi:hypothetical protein